MKDTTSAVLIGTAVGDALGQPFEVYGSMPRPPALDTWDGKSFLAGLSHPFKAGQFTDDTQMSMALAESLIEMGHYDAQFTAHKYLSWMRSGDCRGMGHTTRAALEALESGIDSLHSGIAGAQGNGTAMRIAPLGVFYHRTPDDIARLTQQDARITHRDSEAEAGAEAVATAVATLLTCDRVDLGLGHPRSWRSPFYERIGHLVEALPPSRLRGRLQCASYTHPQEAERMWGAKGHVLVTVPLAFSCFLHTNSFAEAVATAVRLGGDTDTTAAITGALAGAYYGLEGIPEAWVQGVEASERLRDLDARLVAARATVYDGS